MRALTLLLLVLLSFTLFVACGTSNEVQELDQMTAADFLQKGDTYYTNGDYDQAIQTYEDLLNRFPTTDLHIETQLNIAASYGQTDRYEDQMELLLRLLRENIIPDRVPLIYVQIGKFYERAAQFNPNVATTDTMDYQIAIQYFDKAYNYKDSQDDQAKSEALYRRALTEVKIGEINKAIEDYRNVTIQFPDTDHNLLALVKLRNPDDVSELMLDETSIISYKKMLGIIATEGEDEDEEEVETEPEAQPMEDQEIENSLFEENDPAEETGIDEATEDPQTVDDDEAGQTPVENDDSFIPVEDPPNTDELESIPTEN